MAAPAGFIVPQILTFIVRFAGGVRGALGRAQGLTANVQTLASTFGASKTAKIVAVTGGISATLESAASAFEAVQGVAETLQIPFASAKDEFERAEKAAAQALEIRSTAKDVGTTAIDLQKLRIVAEVLEGTPPEFLDEIVQDFEAGRDSEAFTTGLAQLSRLTGKAIDQRSSTFELILQIAEAFHSLGDSQLQEKMGSALQLESLLPLLVRGRDPMSDVLTGLGDNQLVSDDQIEQAVQFAEELRRFRRVQDSDSSPVLSNLSSRLMEIRQAQETKKRVQSVDEQLFVVLRNEGFTDEFLAWLKDPNVLEPHVERDGIIIMRDTEENRKKFQELMRFEDESDVRFSEAMARLSISDLLKTSDPEKAKELFDIQRDLGIQESLFGPAREGQKESERQQRRRDILDTKRITNRIRALLGSENALRILEASSDGSSGPLAFTESQIAWIRNLLHLVNSAKDEAGLVRDLGPESQNAIEALREILNRALNDNGAGLTVPSGQVPGRPRGQLSSLPDIVADPDGLLRPGTAGRLGWVQQIVEFRNAPPGTRVSTDSSPNMKVESEVGFSMAHAWT